MLVLTRKQGQSIVIGESIEVYVVEVRGDQVRLGIQAPRSVSVVRREVLGEEAPLVKTDEPANPEG